MLSALLQSLFETRSNALEIAERIGHQRLQTLLEAAQEELNERTERALKNVGPDSWSATRAKSLLKQVEWIVGQTTPRIGQIVRTTGKEAARESAESLVEYLHQAEETHLGAERIVNIDGAAIVDTAVAGTDSSLLRRLMSSKSPKSVGILERYGSKTVENFEKRIQQAQLTETPWEEVRQGLITDSPFLKEMPMFWAERIVRTETAYASNRANWLGMREANEDFEDGVKILSAMIGDPRTAADSLAVHGQVRALDELFDSWNGSYMHPPDRPNDREVVVMHRRSWQLPEELRPRPWNEVVEAWQRAGRKGAPPARPLQSTIQEFRVKKL